MSDSFDALYTREAPRLVALSLSLTGNREAARDVAQEALLRAYREWGRVSLMDRPGAWVRRVAINLATDAHRRLQRERTAVSRLAAQPAAVFDEPDIDRFWAVVRDLPDRQRVVVALRYADDMSVEDIASVLDITEGTVTKTLFMARRSLAARLGEEES